MFAACCGFAGWARAPALPKDCLVPRGAATALRCSWAWEAQFREGFFQEEHLETERVLEVEIKIACDGS